PIAGSHDPSAFRILRHQPGPPERRGQPPSARANTSTGVFPSAAMEARCPAGAWSGLRASRPYYTIPSTTGINSMVTSAWILLSVLVGPVVPPGGRARAAQSQPALV